MKLESFNGEYDMSLPITAIEFFMGGKGNPLTKDLKKKSRFAKLMDLLRGRK